jgi:hypothetical protein
MPRQIEKSPGFWSAVSAIWESLIIALGTFNRAVRTTDNYVMWAEEGSEDFLKTERERRQSELADLRDE